MCAMRAQSRGTRPGSGEFPESHDVSELSRWRRCWVGEGGGGGQRMQEGQLCSVMFRAVLCPGNCLCPGQLASEVRGQRCRRERKARTRPWALSAGGRELLKAEKALIVFWKTIK